MSFCTLLNAMMYINAAFDDRYQPVTFIAFSIASIVAATTHTSRKTLFAWSTVAKFSYASGLSKILDGPWWISVLVLPRSSMLRCRIRQKFFFCRAPFCTLFICLISPTLCAAIFFITKMRGYIYVYGGEKTYVASCMPCEKNESGFKWLRSRRLKRKIEIWRKTFRHLYFHKSHVTLDSRKYFFPSNLDFFQIFVNQAIWSNPHFRTWHTWG